MTLSDLDRCNAKNPFSGRTLCVYPLVIRALTVYAFLCHKTEVNAVAVYVVTTSCRRAAATICPAPLLPRGRRRLSRGRADGNVAAVSHGHHVPAPTAAAA